MSEHAKCGGTGEAKEGDEHIQEMVNGVMNSIEKKSKLKIFILSFFILFNLVKRRDQSQK